jgi:hypothetical protein
MLMVFRLAKVQTVKQLLQTDDLGASCGCPFDLGDRVAEIGGNIGRAVQLNGGDLESLRFLLHEVPVRPKNKKTKTDSTPTCDSCLNRMPIPRAI